MTIEVHDDRLTHAIADSERYDANIGCALLDIQAECELFLRLTVQAIGL